MKLRLVKHCARSPEEIDRLSRLAFSKLSVSPSKGRRQLAHDWNRLLKFIYEPNPDSSIQAAVNSIKISNSWQKAYNDVILATTVPDKARAIKAAKLTVNEILCGQLPQWVKKWQLIERIRARQVINDRLQKEVEE